MHHVFGIVALIVLAGAIAGLVRAHLEERRAKRRL